VTGRGDVALITAALFALHPSRIEAVAWVADRKDLVSATLFFAALLAWAHGRRGVTTALYLLALLAKPTVLPLPVLLVLVDWLRLGRPLTRQDALTAVRRVAPLLVVMVAFAFVAFFAQRSAGAVMALEPSAWSERTARAAVHLASYFGRFVVPVPVSILHPLKVVPPGAGVAAALGLLALGVASLRALRDGRGAALGFAFCWTVTLLLPVCGLVQIGTQSIADRWLLLPSTGLVAGLVMAAPANRLRDVGAALLVLLCAGLTSWQLPVFRSSEAVFTQALELDPENMLAQLNLGVTKEARGDFEAAAFHARAAMRLNPRSPMAVNNLGNALALQGNLGEAETQFRAAIELDPAFASGWYNLGRLAMVRGQPGAAVAPYARAVELEPFNGKHALGLGSALLIAGQLVEARGQLTRAVELVPGDAEAWAWLARAQRMLSDPAARESVVHALALNPAQPVALEEQGLVR
jgi:Flp pilus assembly protein TadD